MALHGWCAVALLAMLAPQAPCQVLPATSQQGILPASASGGPVSALEALSIGFEVVQQRRTETRFQAAAAGGFAFAPPPNQAGRLLFAFRRARPETRQEAECTGRLLLEASKTFVQRNRIPPRNVREALLQQSSGVSQTDCQRLVRQLVGCDLVEPPTPVCSPGFPYRSIDGSCNNLANPKWGAAMIPFRRFLDPAYEDGVDSMRGTNRPPGSALPSPRTVSTNLHNAEQRPQRGLVTLMLMQWGQFTDHDIVHTPEAAGGEGEEEATPIMCCETGSETPVSDGVQDCQPIDVSADPLHSGVGRACMRFVRSLIGNQGCVLSPREQTNQITAYVDGSMVYGSDEEQSRNLRLSRGGQLNVTRSSIPGHGDLLPFLQCEPEEGMVTGGQCFKGGDVRVNEQPGLASMHTLWTRAHNTLAAQLSVVNPSWDNDRLYEETRRIIGALIQQITYRDFLPIVLGDALMREFDLYPLPAGYSNSYNPSIDASIANAFATAAYRFGHTLVDDVLRGAGTSIPLVGNFFNPRPLFQFQTRPSALLEGLASANAQPADAHLVSALTHNLFKQETEPIGMDLMALNIQRGRDHGIPPYTAWRRGCNLPVPTSANDLAQIMSPAVAQVFQRLYPSVDDIDLFPAGLAEQPVPDGLLGPTFTCIIAHQFARLKRGDRFWFENPNQPKPFTEAQLASIRRIGLSSILCQNSNNLSSGNSFSLTHFQFSMRVTMLQYLYIAKVICLILCNEPRPCASFPSLDVSLWRDGSTNPEANVSYNRIRRPSLRLTTSLFPHPADRKVCIKHQCRVSSIRDTAALQSLFEPVHLDDGNKIAVSVMCVLLILFFITKLKLKHVLNHSKIPRFICSFPSSKVN
ncbi:chorion peroxidase-like [Penaeus monodon]|uniref:chorion peroxidase-like n=1 Tax=Penaeus monodon TaxID=6687 RepID=UPI0018A7D52C|nr:chorion peroxidase-like [Penaeus monodon]